MLELHGLVADPDDGVDLDVDADQVGLSGRARRERVGEELAVHPVVFVEVLQRTQVRGDANCILKASAARLCDVLEVAERLTYLVGDGFTDPLAFCVERALSGEEEQTSGSDRLRVRPGGWRCVRACDRLAFHRADSLSVPW